MTVADLILLLQALPQHARVMVNGYEGGLEDGEGAVFHRVALNVNPESYYGPHQEVESQFPADIPEGSEQVDAVIVY